MNLPATCNTNSFCMEDLSRRDPIRQCVAMVRIGNDIAEKLNVAFGCEKVAIRYLNIPNYDAESPDYNPDCLIARYQITLLQ